MKKTRICPKCDGNKLLYLKQVADRSSRADAEGFDDEYATDPSAKASASAAWRIARLPLPADQRSWWKVDQATAGVVEAYICRACSYTEFYTRGVDQIPVDGDMVQALDGPEGEGPFR